MPKSIHTGEYRAMLSELRRLREDQEVTQEELAKRIGMTQSNYSKCERSERRIDLAELRRMCHALSTTLPEFVARYEERLRVDAD